MACKTFGNRRKRRPKNVFFLQAHLQVCRTHLDATTPCFVLFLWLLLAAGPDSDRPRGGVNFFLGGWGTCLPTPHAANCKLQPSSHQSPRHRLACLPRDCSPQPVSQSPPFLGGVRPGATGKRQRRPLCTKKQLQDWPCSSSKKKKKKARSTGEIDGCVINSKQGKKEEKACQRQKRER